jgi:Zn finger protein HypA/HybF involved in hydrogenase expression
MAQRKRRMIALPKAKPNFRCRSCGKEFYLKPSPKRFVLVKCKKCGSTDVEIL